MVQTVEIFYSFQCPYSYLAIDRLCQLEQKYDIKTLWQPFSAKATGKGFQPHTIPQDKASYIREDVVRLAKRMEMPLVIKSDWPENEFDPERSIRGAVVASDLDRSMEFNIKVFHRWWGEGEDVNSQEFFVQLCDELDLDPNEFSGRINTTDTRERVRGIYKRGRKLGVFDTPMVLIGEERFYGIDRLDDVEERLSSLSLKKAAWA